MSRAAFVLGVLVSLLAAAGCVTPCPCPAALCLALRAPPAPGEEFDFRAEAARTNRLLLVPSHR